MKCLACLSLLFVISCAPAVDTDALATHAVETFQAQATATPAPSATSDFPSPTPRTEAPADVRSYLTNVRVRTKDTFDVPAEMLDYALPDMKRVEGRLRMEGHRWNGAAWSSIRYPEGTAFVFDFIQDASESVSGFWFDVFVEVGTWQEQDYKRFGVFLRRTPDADIWEGPNRGSVTGRQLAGDLVIEPRIQYRILTAVGPDADFLCVIWNPENPAVTRTLRLPMGGEWSGKGWLFGISGNEGILLVDDFTVLSFDSIK